jgi:16S rRNA (guanine(966)-N(2))-methyltransferase RsmD
MTIRVIGGSAKGRQLKLVPGETTRPVMDRVKESLFNIIGRDIFDSAFCDLFAGTGSVGIEALSRGARSSVFFDAEPRAIATIQQNLTLTKLSHLATVRQADAFAVLKQPPAWKFDYIYIAPPQYKHLWSKAVLLLDGGKNWLTEEGMVIAQIDPTEREDLDLKHLKLTDERKYGSTLLLFYEQVAQPDGETA